MSDAEHPATPDAPVNPTAADHEAAARRAAWATAHAAALRAQDDWIERHGRPFRPFRHVMVGPFHP